MYVFCCRYSLRERLPGRDGGGVVVPGGRVAPTLGTCRPSRRRKDDKQLQRAGHATACRGAAESNSDSKRDFCDRKCSISVGRTC